MIDQFEFHIPTHVLFGSAQLENLHTKEFPGRKALIVTTNGGSAKRHGSLDALIAQYAIGWNLHRISRFTKAAMRLAIFEMLYLQDVPTGVAINECVELTRKYEDAEVVSFVNGILGSVARGQQKKEEQQ